MDRKTLHEAIVFNKFVNKCPYHIDPATIQKMDPPDFRCSFKDGTLKYFELVQCIDDSIAKQFGDGHSFYDACKKGVNNLLENDRKSFNEKYNGASIFVTFCPEITGNKRKAIVNNLIDSLLRLSPGLVGKIIPENPLDKFVISLDITRAGFDGTLLFDSTNGCSFFDHALENISGKFMKNYNINESMDLLAYYYLQPVLPEQFWFLDVQEYIKKNISRSQFSRVWIYSFHQDQIIYSYPEIIV